MKMEKADAKRLCAVLGGKTFKVVQEWDGGVGGNVWTGSVTDVDYSDICEEAFYMNKVGCTNQVVGFTIPARDVADLLGGKEVRVRHFGFTNVITVV